MPSHKPTLSAGVGWMAKKIKAERRKQFAQKAYHQLVSRKRAKVPIIRNVIVAFLVGGCIAVIGQVLFMLFVYLGFPEEQAGDPTVATLILIASVLTGFGVWDVFGQCAGAGAGVPVTGFANSIVSSALEFKRECQTAGCSSSTEPANPCSPGAQVAVAARLFCADTL